MSSPVIISPSAADKVRGEKHRDEYYRNSLVRANQTLAKQLDKTPKWNVVARLRLRRGIRRNRKQLGL